MTVDLDQGTSIFGMKGIERPDWSWRPNLVSQTGLNVVLQGSVRGDTLSKAVGEVNFSPRIPRPYLKKYGRYGPT